MDDRSAAVGVVLRIGGDVAALHPAGAPAEWDAAVEAACADLMQGAVTGDVIAALLARLGDPASGVRSEPDLPPDRTVAPGEGADVTEPALRVVDGATVVDGPRLRSIDSTHDLPPALDRTFAALPAQGPVVLDLRGVGPHLVRGVADRLARLLPRPLEIPGLRAATYPWYEGPRGWVHLADQSLEGGGSAARAVAVVVDHDSAALRLALGLRLSVGASVVQHGVLHAAPAVTLRYPLPGGDLVARVRTAEVVRAGAPVDPTPDVVVAADADPVVAAAGLLAGRRPAPPQTVRADGMAPTNSDGRWSMLMRLDTAIRLRFAYHHLLDEPWDQVVADTVDVFAGGDRRDAELALSAAVTRLCDGHALLYAPAVLSILGRHRPDVLVVEIGGELVVAQVGPGVTGVRPGDAIVTVDGSPVATRLATIAPLLPASTPHGHTFRCRSLLLAGPQGTDVVVGVVGADGAERSVTLPRSLDQPPSPTSQLPVWTVPRPGIGYVDVGRLAPREVAPAFDAIAGTDAVVLDLRRYPRSTGMLVAGRLTDRPVVGARMRRPTPTAPYDGSAPWGHPTTSDVHIEQVVHPIRPTYHGRVVVIVDAGTISQGEHTALFLEAAADALFVGAPSNGTNGNVVTADLGGDVSALYTGIDVTHADGRQLQRVGVLPKVSAVPSRAGLAAGVDEVLEAALAAARDT